MKSKSMAIFTEEVFYKKVQRLLRFLLVFFTLVFYATQTLAQEVVAKVEVKAPEVTHSDFLLQVSVPLPEYRYVPSEWSAAEPFQIRASNGSLFIAQTRASHFYPDRAKGASIVQVAARVPRGSLAAGATMSFDLVSYPHPKSGGVIHPALLTLLNQPGQLVLRAEDVHGNRYRADLFQELFSGGRFYELVSEGHQYLEFITRNVLMPEVGANPGSRLPHFMGADLVIRIPKIEGYAIFDLLVHNGFTGQDGNDPSDDTLGDIFFRSIWFEGSGLGGGAGSYELIPQVLTPYMGSRGGNRYDLVKPLQLIPGYEQEPGLHFMQHRTQMWRKFALVVRNDTRAYELAGAELKRMFHGVVVAGEDPAGNSLHSWQSLGYGPDKQRAPDFSYINRIELDSDVQPLLDRSLEFLRTGIANGYPNIHNLYGYLSFKWPQHGGMAGGEGIVAYPGLKFIASGNPLHLYFEDISNMLVGDRQRAPWRNADRRPLTPEEMLQEKWYGLSAEFVYTNGRPWQGFDPEGVASSPAHQRNFVAQEGLAPSYMREWRELVQPHDNQHLIRATAPAIARVFLAGDTAARLYLEDTALTNQFEYHQYVTGNPTWGAPFEFGLHRSLLQTGVLRPSWWQVQSYSRQGVWAGRELAHHHTSLTTVYSMMEESSRQAATRERLRLAALVKVLGLRKRAGGAYGGWMRQKNWWMQAHTGMQRASFATFESDFEVRSLRAILESALRGVAVELERPVLFALYAQATELRRDMFNEITRTPWACTFLTDEGQGWNLEVPISSEYEPCAPDFMSDSIYHPNIYAEGSDALAEIDSASVGPVRSLLVSTLQEAFGNDLELHFLRADGSNLDWQATAIRFIQDIGSSSQFRLPGEGGKNRKKKRFKVKKRKCKAAVRAQTSIGKRREKVQQCLAIGLKNISSRGMPLGEIF